MEISLSFKKDREILEKTFEEPLLSLSAKNINIKKQIYGTKNGFCFHFALEEITDHWFLLPLTIAKALTFYTAEHREKGFLNEILQKYYFFLDNDIKESTNRILEIERKNQKNSEQRQMLLFFPIINYFSQNLPQITFNYEGFLLFRAGGYWASLDQMVMACAEEAFFEEERKYNTILYPHLHKETKKKKKETEKGKKKDKR